MLKVVDSLEHQGNDKRVEDVEEGGSTSEQGVDKAEIGKVSKVEGDETVVEELVIPSCLA